MRPSLLLSLILLTPLAIAAAESVGGSKQNANPVVSRDKKQPSNSRRALSGPKHILTCSPAPCALPNILIEAAQAYNTVPAANPGKQTQLLATLDENYGGSCPFGSRDGGAIWYQDASDRCGGETPTLAYGNRNVAYQAGSNYDAGIFLTKTTDNGKTWVSAVEVVQPLFSQGSVVTPWLVVDNSASSQFADSLYLAVTQLGGQGQSQITVSYSRNGGTTWTRNLVDELQTEPEVDRYSRIAVAADGTVYVTWQRCETLGEHANCGGQVAHLLMSKSTDGGNTWSSVVEIASVHLVPDSCNCAFFGNLPNTTDAVANPPVIAVDNSSGSYAGTLYVEAYDWTKKQMRVELFSSPDGGNTWGAPVWVASPHPHDEFFAGLSVSPTGAVGVSWLDRRNDKHNVFYQPFVAVSSDGGKTFGKNYRLARNRSNPYYSAYSMGDYTGNTWAGKTLYVTWPDTRNAIMQDYVGGLRTK